MVAWRNRGNRDSRELLDSVILGLNDCIRLCVDVAELHTVTSRGVGISI